MNNSYFSLFNIRLCHSTRRTVKAGTSWGWGCSRRNKSICVSRAILACPCVFWLAQRAKTCDKIWYLGPLPNDQFINFVFIMDTQSTKCKSKAVLTSTIPCLWVFLQVQLQLPRVTNTRAPCWPPVAASAAGVITATGSWGRATLPADTPQLLWSGWAQVELVTLFWFYPYIIFLWIDRIDLAS